MKEITINFPVSIPFRVRFRATTDQNRTIYLATRPYREKALAEEWRSTQGMRELALKTRELKQQIDGLRSALETLAESGEWR